MRIAFAALLLSISAVSVAAVWQEFASDPSLADPVVEVTRVDDTVMSHVATFAPRVGLPSDVEYNHTFQLYNDGAEAMVIAEAKKSCSCFEVDVDRESISPGE